MGLTDKISGRIKQAAGDLAGNDALRREGQQEERKGEARQELAEHEAAADRRAAEVDALEHRTDAGKVAEDRTKDELSAEAQALGIEGRSDMTKDELAKAIRDSR